MQNRRVALVVLLGALLVLLAGTRRVAGEPVISLSFYLPTGQAMASGLPPWQGAAACSPELMVNGWGTRLRFTATGDEVSCWDTGSAVLWRQVDVFQWDSAAGRAFIARNGERAEIETVGD